MDAEELIENFELFEAWEDRYRYLIDLGKQLEPLDDSFKTDAHKVHGCLSQVWFVRKPDSEDGRVRFVADSDSAIVKGLIAVVMALFDNKRPAEMRDVDAQAVFDDLGFGNHISFNRRNGFAAMVKRVVELANA